MKNIFDTHCHPHLNKEKKQDEIIKRFFDNWWRYMTVVWTNPTTNKIVINTAKKYSWVFCSVWIHPCDVYDLNIKQTITQLENSLIENKNNIVAIWECWLDYYWLYKDENINKLTNKLEIIENKKNIQKIFFEEQILLAKKYNLPIIIHNRNSKDDVLSILKKMDFKNFIFHCYSENLDYANELIKFSPNCKISFSWIVTFKSAKEVQDTAKFINIKHIIAETDSPYLTPTPFRWKEENEPIFTKHIIEKIEELRWEKCSTQIMNNSINIFWIK